MITDYTSLKAEVRDFMHRTDLDAKMDVFCQLAETMINKDLTVIQMEVKEDVVLTETFTALPDDFISFRALHIENAGARVPIPQLTPQQLDKRYSRASGSIKAFAVHGGYIEFRPGIDGGDPVQAEFSYFAEVPTIVTNTTNKVLLRYPFIYLTAMMLQATGYIQDDAEQSKWLSAYDAQIQAANSKAQAGRYYLPTIGV